MVDVLKPCPWHGDSSDLETEDNGGGCFWVVCTKSGCGCEGPYGYSADEAAQKWNRRSTLSDAVAEREAEPVAFPECVLGMTNEKITLAFENSEDARVAFDIIEHTITSPPTSELEALRKRVAELEKALEPFSGMAGEMFKRGWDASNVAIALDNPNDQHRVTAGDFFAARRVREGGKVDG